MTAQYLYFAETLPQISLATIHGMPLKFRLPKLVKIAGRSSSVTNAFVQTLLPRHRPSDKDLQKNLELLGIDPDNPVCAYCGDPPTEWDHLNPLVANQRPTGHITEAANLVPACSKCNQSKSGAYWRDWIRSNGPQSPATRNIPDLEARIQALEHFEHAQPCTKVLFESLIGPQRWAEYWAAHDDILEKLRLAQRLGEELHVLVSGDATGGKPLNRRRSNK